MVSNIHEPLRFLDIVIHKPRGPIADLATLIDLDFVENGKLNVTAYLPEECSGWQNRRALFLAQFILQYCTQNSSNHEITVRFEDDNLAGRRLSKKERSQFQLGVTGIPVNAG